MIETNKNKPLRRSGRPSLKQAGRIKENILDIATGLFFTQGYGATSIEAVSELAQISKRTFYSRFEDKADLFRAVVHRVIENLRPKNSDSKHLFQGKNLEEALLQLARMILDAALTPQALALYRIVLAEAGRFPELAITMNREGARQEAVRTIAAILQQEKRTAHLIPDDAVFAAEQFLQMVVSLPQRRAFGLGRPMSPIELDSWIHATVDLFLRGCLRQTF